MIAIAVTFIGACAVVLSVAMFCMTWQRIALMRVRKDAGLPPASNTQV